MRCDTVSRTLVVTLFLATTTGARAVETAAQPAFDGTALDRAIEDALAAKGLAAAAPCDDATFLRRVHLDLAGTLPTAEEVAEFLEDTAADKRARVIDRLLESPAFAGYWGGVIRRMVSGPTAKKQNAKLARQMDSWIADEIGKGTGYDLLVSQMLSAEGRFDKNPATGFILAAGETPEEMAAVASNVFLGAQVQCAQCHDHPFEKWTQKDFYGLTAFFARTKAMPLPEPALELLEMGVNPVQARRLLKGVIMGDEEQQARMQKRMKRMEKRGQPMMRMGMASDDEMDDPDQPMPDSREILAAVERIKTALVDPATGKPAEKVGRMPVILERPRGEAIIPDPKAPPPVKGQPPQGETVAPRFLDGTSVTMGPRDNRRQALAEWVTAPSNPFFARAAVNRFFACFTGRGVVQPVDNVAAPDDTALSPLLDQMAKDFAGSGYDLRRLFRMIAGSRAYQRSGAVAPGAKEAGGHHFQRAPPRALTPEQLYAAFLRATGMGNMQALRHDEERANKMMENGFRQFVVTFDKDDAPAEAEEFQETIPQALMILNSQAFNRATMALPGNNLGETLELTRDPGERIDMLFLHTLSRYATDAERQRFVDYVEQAPVPEAGRGKRRKAAARGPYEDVFWALTASAEFLYNH